MMEPQEKLTPHQFVIDRLQDIQRKAEASNYIDALSLIKEVKAADAKNIYVIALEKQIVKLEDTSLLSENRTEIIKSLPAMIDRAISDIQRRASLPKADEAQKEQKEAALEKLKNQYFQRADDYVSKKEYQRALEEIRRIYIIEPGSVVAKEYEQKIEQLAALHARSENQSGGNDIQESVPTKIADEEPKTHYILEEEPPKSKIPIFIAAGVAVAAIIVWLIISKSSDTAINPNLSSKVSTDDIPSSFSTTTTSTPESGKQTKTEQPPTEIQKSEQQPVVAKEEKTQVTAPVKTEAKQQPPAQNKPSPPVQTTRPQPAPIQQTVQPAAAPVQQQIQQQQPPAQPAQQQTKVAESTPAPMPFVSIENPPEVIHKEPAKYPNLALKMGLQGRVTVEVTVDMQGKPIQTKIVKSSSDVFNDAALEAVMKYTFKPAMNSTGPITAKMFIPIDFRMAGSPWK